MAITILKIGVITVVVIVFLISFGIVWYDKGYNHGWSDEQSTRTALFATPKSNKNKKESPQREAP